MTSRFSSETVRVCRYLFLAWILFGVNTLKAHNASMIKHRFLGDDMKGDRTADKILNRTFQQLDRVIRRRKDEISGSERTCRRNEQHEVHPDHETVGHSDSR